MFLTASLGLVSFLEIQRAQISFLSSRNAFLLALASLLILLAAFLEALHALFKAWRFFGIVGGAVFQISLERSQRLAI